MKAIILRRLVYTFGILLLTAFFSACGSSTPTQATASTPSSTATQATAPTPSSTPTQTTAPTSSSTPAPAALTGFQHLTGANFTIDYPVGWQTSHKTQAGGSSSGTGSASGNQTMDTYGFVASDNLTGLHIVRHGDEQAVGGMVNELLGGQLSCSTGDKSVPSQVTVGGATWTQVDLVCLIANYYYEVRELVTSSPQYGQTVIMYGAYQQVGNGAVAPDFAHSSDMYFKPMLASFQFN